jgi:1,4-dihydroxy-2-naphthoate octaprenyltransferase
MKNARSWILAARPKTLTAAVVPFAAGAALAFDKEGSLSWGILALCFACSLLIQIATNLINDALDSMRGRDTERRLGPIRVCHAGFLSENEVLRAGIGCLLAAAILGLPLIFRGGPELSIVFGISLLCGYAYTGGPFPLSTNGLGELFAFLFFGVVATAASFYLQALHWSFDSVVLGMQIGLLAAAIASINNYRDQEEDATTGKKTLAVRFGATFAKFLIAGLLLLPYAMETHWIHAGYTLAGLLPFAALPLALFLIYGVFTTPPSAKYNMFLGVSALHHLLFGALFITGLLA